MAGRGPTPKPDEQRQRMNATVAMTDLDTAAKVAAPRLPGSSKYRPETRAWYRIWCNAPQASQFIATDWLRLHMVAQLVDRFYRTDNDQVAKQLLGEIRLNEQKLGATPEDRLRLRWRWREEDAPALPESGRPRRRSSRSGTADPRLALLEGGAA